MYASDIIKEKIKAAGGKITVTSINNKSYEICDGLDGETFYCDALPKTQPFTYRIFDIIVNLLVEENGKALKGHGRTAKLGAPDCELTTVNGAIGKYYFGKEIGDSVLDPVFVLAAVLDWAGLATNHRGYIEFTAQARVKFMKS